ncbi:hypothetical protein [Roseivirga spongicola]|uniref:hypothetical protein n=1 Tax=Roseivirga spongicola TaxID=333140 RepID=UPI002AC8A97C|nr:hypothetical protein [Roseivirga spongicola]WPZ08774.1 hypothetical protein T7867_10945 [Roseivirga spongicola]
MAVTVSFNATAQTVDGETMTFTDQTSYSDPARNELALIMRVYHLNQDLTATRKEFNTYDPTTVSTWTLSVDQTADGISPIDGVHKLVLFALDASLYEGISGGKFQIDGADEDSYTDAELTALSEDTATAYALPLPKLHQEANDILLSLSDHDVDLDIPALSYQVAPILTKIMAAQSLAQTGKYSSAARVIEIE